jgi:hypothetical protein
MILRAITNARDPEGKNLNDLNEALLAMTATPYICRFNVPVCSTECEKTPVTRKAL